jgi:hypothetical protein
VFAFLRSYRKKFQRVLPPERVGVPACGLIRDRHGGHDDQGGGEHEVRERRPAIKGDSRRISLSARMDAEHVRRAIFRAVPCAARDDDIG